MKVLKMKTPFALSGSALTMCLCAFLSMSLTPDALAQKTASQAKEEARDELLTRDHFVTHSSTLSVNRHQPVGLFLREKVLSVKQNAKLPVVLFVHGATVPSMPDFDFNYQDYNWMAFLARRGFRVYAMDLSGYGGSPRPLMDDPCNVAPSFQSIMVPRPLSAACSPKPSREFNTIHDDWAEMDSVVDHLRRVNHIKRIHIVGWSAGGPRVGGYMSKHPEKIERAMLYAPSPTVAKDPSSLPSEGYPMSIQTRDDFELKRWDPDVRCANQVQAGLRDVLWTEIMKWDAVGSTWGPEGVGVMRGRISSQFNWTPQMAQKVDTPTVVVVGEFDRLAERRTVFDQLSSKKKVFVGVQCASHFMLWEKQRHVLHETSLEWFQKGTVKGAYKGIFNVDEQQRYTRVDEVSSARP